MPQKHWLVKQEPGSYSWAAFVEEGGTAWTGVRNFQARNNLRAMKKGDWVFFYHSGEEKQLVGLARLEKEAYPDPTATEGEWSSVDLAPAKALKKPVTLTAIKSDPILKQMDLLRQSRLSVVGVKETEFRRLLELSETKV
ncbi:MAG: EVE domain-containing protein [Verrucomicrobia bacterium]|nr:EVE domain-containing protein [Verrucomicrobiota bacterium]